MASRAGRRTKNQEKIARDRITILLEMAKESSYKQDYEQSARFVELAILISKRYNQRLTKKQRLQICRKCFTYFHSQTSKNRMSAKGWKVVTCLSCNSVSRYKT